jgi:hypothetical protein
MPTPQESPTFGRALVCSVEGTSLQELYKTHGNRSSELDEPALQGCASLGDRPRDPPRPEGHGEAGRPDRRRPRVGPLQDPAVAAVTSPPQVVEVECPRCQTVYETFWRPSINLTLGEEWTAEELEEATTGLCPTCGLRVELGSLVVGADGVSGRSSDGARRATGRAP